MFQIEVGTIMKYLSSKNEIKIFFFNSRLTHAAFSPHILICVMSSDRFDNWLFSDVIYMEISQSIREDV